MDSASRAELSRQQIVDAAHELFLQRGYHATSMRQVARQAGVALGGIYNHFASKDALFSAVLDAYHPYHDILPALASAEGQSIDQLLRDAARHVIATLRERPDFLNLMFIEVVEFKGRHMPDLIEQILPKMVDILRRYQTSSGELRDIPSPIIIRAFLGLFFSYIITEMLLSPEVAAVFPEDTLDRFVDILLYGIMQQGPGTAMAGGGR